jgi:hypothetical protein
VRPSDNSDWTQRRSVRRMSSKLHGMSASARYTHESTNLKGSMSRVGICRPFIQKTLVPAGIFVACIPRSSPSRSSSILGIHAARLWAYFGKSWESRTKVSSGWVDATINRVARRPRSWRKAFSDGHYAEMIICSPSTSLDLTGINSRDAASSSRPKGPMVSSAASNDAGPREWAELSLASTARSSMAR